MATDKPAVSIGAGVKQLHQELPAGAVEKLAYLLAELERWNERINLTAIRNVAAMVPGHILDSLAARPFLHGTRVIDVGTGAGFPGLPLAIAEPATEFLLLDANRKKVGFVEHVTGELELRNVTVVRSRVEDYAPGWRFDTVMTRAFAPLQQMLELAGHLVDEGGQMLALKGKYPAAEIESVETAGLWSCVASDVTIPGLEAHARHVVALRRIEYL